MKALLYIFFLQLSGLATQPGSNGMPTSDCRQRILAQDDSLGSIRNRATEGMALGEAIEQYVAALQQLDFSQCSAAFTQTFKQHIAAWKAMLPVVRQFPQLRGEMHALFDIIALSPQREEFQQRLQAIWDTWALVERAGAHNE